jgi:hypothetical protein
MKERMTAVAAAILLAACGGGGGDSAPAPAPTPSPSAAGQYIGTVNNRQTTALVLDDGRFYTQYSVVGQPGVIAGVVAGTVASSDGKLSNGAGSDYNLEGQGVVPVTVSGTYVAKQSINATTTYSPTVQSTLNGSFDQTYNTTPTQAAVTGTFVGSSASPGFLSDVATITADANGNITGQGTNCAFTGSIKPHASGNVYDVSLTFGAGSCLFPNTTATGIGVLSGSVIHAFVQTPSKQGILFLGSK